MGRKRKAAGDRRKKVSIKLLERKHSGRITTPYKILEDLIETVQDHAHLKHAKIAIAWRFNKKADIDGRLWLGHAKKGSDLDRAMWDGFDFVICLNHEIWNSAGFTQAQMTALIDHELSHCAPLMDKNGSQVIDEEGRRCWRIRKHDVEEFRGVVARRGLWKDDVRELVEAADRFKELPILKVAEEAEAKREDKKRKPSKPSKPPATSNGAKRRRFPARIKLLHDIVDFANETGGLFATRECEVVDWVNGEVVIKADSGERVSLSAAYYTTIRWDDSPAKAE